MTSCTYGARSPRSHYDAILIVTSFATELTTPTVMDYCMDILPCLIHKDVMLRQLEEAFIDQKKQEALQRQEEEKRRERERLDEMKRREQERILEVHCVFVLFWLQNEW